MTALTHSTDWHTGPALQGPAVCRAGARARGRDERRARQRDGCRAGTADFRWRVKAYTRAGPGLTGTILIWVRAAMAERRAGGSDGTDWGTCLSLCQPSLQSDSENPSLIHPSELGPRLRLRWTMAPEGWGQGEDWLSTLTIGDSDGRDEEAVSERGPDTF